VTVDTLEADAVAAVESFFSEPQAVVRAPAENISTVRVSAEPCTVGRRRVRAEFCAEVRMLPFH
jgi:hypothetical protein